MSIFKKKVPYPEEVLDSDMDDGTMPNNLDAFAEEVIGFRIVDIEQDGGRTILTLNSGKRVVLVDTSDCCACTELEAFLLHPDRVDHIITGVGTTNGYSTWHIYADMGDILELTVNWSPGNPFYYGYGFSIEVEEPEFFIIHEMQDLPSTTEG